MPANASILLELIRSGLALVLLAAGWFVGQRIIVAWDLRKKRQELDVAAAEGFQRLYGDLKEVARLWRSAKRPKDASIVPPPTLRWDLLARSTAAESRYEALVIKLATERRLTAEQILTLGLFRQACQQIREAMQIDEVARSSGFGAEYLLFNDLAAEITCLVGTTNKPAALEPARARHNLEAVALVRTADWRRRVREYEATKLPRIRDDHPEIPRAGDRSTSLPDPEAAS